MLRVSLEVIEFKAKQFEQLSKATNNGNNKRKTRNNAASNLAQSGNYCFYLAMEDNGDDDSDDHLRDSDFSPCQYYTIKELKKCVTNFNHSHN